MTPFPITSSTRLRSGRIFSNLLAGLGISLLVTSQAQAAKVAFWAEHVPFPSLGSAHTVTLVSTADIDAGALQNYDVVVAGHVPRGTANTCSRIAAFLAAGKGMVGEWNGATVLFHPSPDAYEPADIACELFAGLASGGGNTFGSELPIDITEPSSPLVAGLSNPFTMGEGSAHVYQLTGLGPEWKVAATFDGEGSSHPAVLAALRPDGGCVALSPFDYFDRDQETGTSRRNMEVLLENLVKWVDPRAGQCGRAMAAAPAATALKSVPTSGILGVLALSCLLAVAGLSRLARR